MATIFYAIIVDQSKENSILVTKEMYRAIINVNILLTLHIIQSMIRC